MSVAPAAVRELHAAAASVSQRLAPLLARIARRLGTLPDPAGRPPPDD